MAEMKNIKDTFPMMLSVLTVYFTTAGHHIYGAILYSTPWRTHIATSGLFWLGLSIALIVAYKAWNRRLILWLFTATTGFFFVGAIGLYEGFYNHMVKNIVYFAGVPEATLLIYYPPPKYELPNDWLFEVTGVLTFLVCTWCARQLINFVKRETVSQ
ncbi:conserved membrane hypothetical protein [Imperialibacter sp. 89]|nr:conserved membrane hypothetical protein [Imperialibacter sp. 89]